MTKQEVTIAKLRTDLANIVNAVSWRGDTVVVTKNNRRAAVIVSPEEYDRLLDPSKRLTKTEREDLASQLEKFRENIPAVDPDKLDKLVNEEVTAVRVAKRRKNKSNKPATSSTASA